MDSIFNRRSVRKYLANKIKDEDIELILKAGMNAPSAHNRKPCSYIVIDDKTILNKIADIHIYAQMLREASHAIVVCAEEKSEFWVQDAAAATQNILLEATTLGIGSCWIGVYPNNLEQQIRDLLNVPAKTRVFSVISLGYPNESKKPNDYYDEKIVHHNRW